MGTRKNFTKGLAVLIVKDESDAQKKKYGYLDLTGRVAIAPQFDEAIEFNEGLAPVRQVKTSRGPVKDDPWGLNDKAGAMWGYIDKTGQYAIKPQFNDTSPFRGGVARVHVGGTLTVYEIHSPPIWEGGEWLLIDRKGSLLKRSKEWVKYEDDPNKPPKPAQ